jgi:DNA-binding CsgD family transcriptional regulator
MDDLQRVAVSGSVVRKFLEAAYALDVTSEAPHVVCPTLIAHADQDPCFPFNESVLLASLISGARLITLRTPNHALIPGDPSLAYLMSEVVPFLQGGLPARDLTARQLQVLVEVAHGKTDKQIARDLELSPRTVEMHVARAMDVLGCRTRVEAVRSWHAHRSTRPSQGRAAPTARNGDLRRMSRAVRQMAASRESTLSAASQPEGQFSTAEFCNLACSPPALAQNRATAMERGDEGLFMAGSARSRVSLEVPLGLTAKAGPWVHVENDTSASTAR